MSVNVNVIKQVVDKTLKSIESSKNEIYKIVENARTQVESIKAELSEVQKQIAAVIDEVDKLEVKDKIMRQRLVQVSKNFRTFSESDVQEVYEKASEVRIAFKMKEQEEKSLRTRRSSLEVNLKQAEDILRSAEKLIGQVSVAMNFLAGELGNVEVSDDESSIEIGIRFLESMENEKKKISREIHDGPAQSLANLVMKADICKAVIKKDVVLGFIELEELKDSVRSTLQEIRHIIYELRPGLLDDHELIPALESLIVDFRKQLGIDIKLVAGTERKDTSSVVQIAVFRLVQEALNNIKKHAEATHVQIRVAFGPKYVDVMIKDDGNGFDTEQVFERIKEAGASYGLRGMKERIEQFYGEFTCISRIGVGTELTFKIPINKEVMLDVYRSN